MRRLDDLRAAAGIQTDIELSSILKQEEGIDLHPSSFSHYRSGRFFPQVQVARALLRVLRRRGVAATMDDLLGEADDVTQTDATGQVCAYSP